MFNSLVNALNYINDFDGRDAVLSKLRASMEFDEYGDLAKNWMKFTMHVINVDVKGYDSRIMKCFDILGDQSYWPTLCILEGSNGGVNHAVTVVEDFIFDSNNHTAIPLTRENLDFCCQSDFSSDIKSQRVHFACRFTRHQAHSQYVLCSYMKYQLAISSMMQCFTHVEDVLASESIQQVSHMLSLGVDVLGMVRDILNRKPHGYQLKIVKSLDELLLRSVEYHPLIALVHVKHTFNYGIVSMVKGQLFDGCSEDARIVSREAIEFSIREPQIPLEKCDGSIELVKGYVFYRGSTLDCVSNVFVNKKVKH